MKKKLVKTLALALALSMIPVMAYGASSSPKNDDDDSSSSESVYEDKTESRYPCSSAAERL